MSKRSNYNRTLTEEESDRIRLKGRKQIKYFNKVYVNVTAANKMLDHAHFGTRCDPPREVMGLLIGSYHEQSNKGVFVVTDIICLPVQSSQTRVTADDETFTIMAAYTEWTAKIGTYNIMGWYHSHPSFGCWLSGIDVNTQELFQKSTDPFLAIVVDPIKSVNLQKLDMAAFRVHTNGYTEQNLANIKDVPRRKAVDFGYHYKRYYQLSMEFVTNSLGQKTLNNVQKMQWANSLSQSSFVSQSEYLREQVNDEKLDLEEYLELKQNPTAKYAEIKQKQKNTLKKVAYYTKERNVSLMDSAIKSLLF